MKLKLDSIEIKIKAKDTSEKRITTEPEFEPNSFDEAIKFLEDMRDSEDYKDEVPF